MGCQSFNLENSGRKFHITTEVFFAIISLMNKIQRKFLVSADIQRWLKTQKHSTEKLELFYSRSDKDTECYYRHSFPDTYTKVVVDKEGQETPSPIMEEEYLAQRKNAIGKKILKETYTVTFKEETFVVFKYLKKLEGMYILEANFKDEKAMRDSEVLQTLQTFVLKEIDRDKKYTDKSLALYVKPMEYNLDKLFENIDAFEAANLFFWQVPGRLYVRDGVTLILYKNLRLLHHYKVNFQQKHNSATLHRLRVLLRRTATLLETFSYLFTPNVQRFCTNLLLRYHEETKLLRYLYFLEDLCTTRENAKISLYSELRTLTFEEETAVTQMLLAKPFTQLIQILTRELYEEEYQQFHPLTKEVKKAVRKQLKQFEKLLAKTKEGYDDELLEEIYTAMDSLQTLIEDFFHVIGEKETQIIVDELNILLKPLREYRNCKERVMVLDHIKAQSANATLDTEPLMCEHEETLKDKIEHALKLLRSSKFYV